MPDARLARSRQGVNVGLIIDRPSAGTLRRPMITADNPALPQRRPPRRVLLLGASDRLPARGNRESSHRSSRTWLCRLATTHGSLRPHAGASGLCRGFRRFRGARTQSDPHVRRRYERRWHDAAPHARSRPRDRCRAWRAVVAPGVERDSATRRSSCHKSISSTAVYTGLAPNRFRGSINPLVRGGGVGILFEYRLDRPKAKSYDAAAAATFESFAAQYTTAVPA